MSAIPPSAPSSIAANLTPGGLATRVGLLVGRGFSPTSLFASSRANQVIRVPWKPLAPAVLAAGMLMYQRGDEARKGHNPNVKTVQLLTDLLIASLLVSHTAGLYSMLAFIKILFDMGWQKDAMDKAKSVVQDVGVFMSAYLGLRFGTWVTEGASQRDDFRMRSILNRRPSVQQWVASRQGQPTNEGQLASHLQQLRFHLNHLYRIKDDPMEAKKLRTGKIEPLNAEAWKLIQQDPQLLKQFEQTKDKGLRSLFEEFQHNQSGYVKLARRVNAPVYGLLFTTLLGVPIIRIVNRWLEKHHPELRGRQVEPFRFPELANRAGAIHGPGNIHALERESAAGHGEEHAAEGHGLAGMSFPNIGTLV